MTRVQGIAVAMLLSVGVLPASSCTPTGEDAPRDDRRGGGRGGDDDDGCVDGSTAACPPPLPEDPVPAPLTVDELVADLDVVSHGTLTIGAISTEGGQVLTLGRFVLRVPAGVLPVGASVEVFEHAFGNTRDETSVSIFRFVPSTQPAGDVSVVFPIPGASAGASLEGRDVYVTWFHGDEQPVDDAGTIDAANALVEVQVNHFSTAVVTNTTATPTVGGSSGVSRNIVKTTFMNQGLDQHCWNVALTMLLNAYGAGLKSWNTATHFQVVPTAGFNTFALQFGPSMSRFAVAQVGQQMPGVDVRVETERWFRASQINTGLREYLRRRLMNNQPVIVSSHGVTTGHAVLVVGYEVAPSGDASQDTIYVADPANAGGTYGMEPWPYQQLADTCAAVSFGCVTFAMTTPVPRDIVADGSFWIASSGRTNVQSEGATVPLETLGIRFQQRASPSDGSWDLASTRRFSWYLADTGTFGIEDMGLKAAGALLGDGVDDRAFIRLGVASNIRPPADGSQPNQIFSLTFTIIDPTGGVKTVADNMQIGLVPRQRRDIDLAKSEPVKNLVSMPGLHQFVFSFKDPAGNVDTASIPVRVTARDVGACVPTCGASQECCNGICVFSSTDNQNCGGCGVVCNGVCGSGTCCDPGACVSGTSGLNSFCSATGGCFTQCGGIGTSQSIEAAGAYCDSICGAGVRNHCIHDFGEEFSGLCLEPDAMGCQCCPA